MDSKSKCSLLQLKCPRGVSCSKGESEGEKVRELREGEGLVDLGGSPMSEEGGVRVLD